MKHSIEVNLCDPAKTYRIDRMTCDTCGMTDTRTGYAMAMFEGWEVREGDNHAHWVVCPKCTRGEQ